MSQPQQTSTPTRSTIAQQRSPSHDRVVAPARTAALAADPARSGRRRLLLVLGSVVGAIVAILALVLAAPFRGDGPAVPARDSNLRFVWPQPLDEGPGQGINGSDQHLYNLAPEAQQPDSPYRFRSPLPGLHDLP